MRPPRWCARTRRRCWRPRVADHERSTGPWEIEWIALPEIFLLAVRRAARRPATWSTGLQVDAARMRANLDLTDGAIVSEAVMMGLGPHLGRQRAHDLVYDICRVAAVEGKPLVDLLAKDQEISKHVSRAELEKMCDPANYLGLAGEMVDRVLKARRRRSAASRARRLTLRDLRAGSSMHSTKRVVTGSFSKFSGGPAAIAWIMVFPIGSAGPGPAASACR